MLGMVNIYQHGVTCYIMNLSQDEQHQVHTVDGKTRLEVCMTDININKITFVVDFSDTTI